MSDLLVLAVECATPDVSVALVRGETTLDEVRAPAGVPAAETLLPAVDELLRRGGVGLSDIRGWAVSVGPGSFTSLRIGIATLKGLAFEAGTPVAPVPTLAALARAGGDSGGSAEGDADLPWVGLLDARRGEIYASAWTHSGLEAHPCLPEGIYTPESLLEHLPGACVLVGEGVGLLDASLAAKPRPGLRLVPPPRGVPSARHVGALGARRLAAGGGIDVADLVPFYGRRAEAEVKRTGLRFESGPSA